MNGSIAFVTGYGFLLCLWQLTHKGQSSDAKKTEALS